jgi:hypothetical protein
MATPTSAADRREHVRFAARELNGLRSARVKYGETIDVIDLSAGGVLFETATPLTHEATIVLEFSGPTKTVLIPSRVVRCQSLRKPDYSVRSQGACVFRRPLGLKDLVVGSTPQDAGGANDDGAAGTWQPVIGKYRDGRLINGYTSDFSPSKPSLHVAPAPSAKDASFLELTELDALFFLRDGGGDDVSTTDESREAAPHGRKVAFVLPSGELLTGSTLNYSRHSSGVFVYPVERDFGVSRVFVTHSGIRNLRLL